MIDPLNETIISLPDAARSCPKRRGGKRVHTSCFNRWTTTGCKGIILESIQVGGTRCTSREALARFFEALTSASPRAPSLKLRSPVRRQRAADAAVRELQRNGI